MVHVCREFLAPTETFIYTQLKALAARDAWVVARRVSNAHQFPFSQSRSFADQPRSPRKMLADALYSSARIMTMFEREQQFRRASALRPELIHGHYAVDSRYFLPVIVRLDRPLVVSCYGYDVSSFPKRLGGLGRRYLSRLWQHASVVLAMSNDMASDLKEIGCPPERIRIHYFGADLDRFQQIDGRPVSLQRILCVGSLNDERKRFDDMIKAFALLAGRFPRLKLRIVGSGTLLDTHRRLAKELGIGDRVDFAGFVPPSKLIDEYRNALVLCHPSATTHTGDKEGIPTVIVEAMATGLPVVSTRHAGIPEMITHQDNGLLVAERDYHGIAESIANLLSDDVKRERLGRSAAARVRAQADARVQADKLTTIYDVLTSQGVHASSVA